MKIIAIYWGYLIGEEHITEQQIAEINFGNPSLDSEFITFDPLASTFFQGKYYSLYEKKHVFPHRKLPSMRSETLVMYKETSIQIMDPPPDLETPVGIFMCLYNGEEKQIEKAKNFLTDKINVKFSKAEIDLQKFYERISKTRLKVKPKSLTIADLNLDEDLFGNFEVFPKNNEQYMKYLNIYKPKIQELNLLIQEINLQIDLKINTNGFLKTEQEIRNLRLKKTIEDIATRSVFTGSK